MLFCVVLKTVLTVFKKKISARISGKPDPDPNLPENPKIRKPGYPIFSGRLTGIHVHIRNLIGWVRSGPDPSEPDRCTFLVNFLFMVDNDERLWT